MVTLDYANFPHIFADIIKHCDLPTQRALRQLSSSVKDDIDRELCRYLIVVRQDGRLRLYGLYGPGEIATAQVFKLPFLQRWNGMLPFYIEEGPEVSEETKVLEFAMRSSRFVGLHAAHIEAMSLGHAGAQDQEDNEGAQPDGALEPPSALESSDEMQQSQVLEPPPLLRLLHSDCCIKLTHAMSDLPHNQLGHSIRLPPVNQLQIDIFNHLGQECRCNPVHQVIHTATKLQVGGYRAPSRFCGFATNVLTPDVRELVIAFDDLEGVDDYVDAIRGKPAHPKLKVVVQSYRNGATRHTWGEFQRKWTEQLGVPVRLRLNE